ncbi:MAG: hypothetical protein WC441_03920 [Patescibacteria group bacterium]
MKLFEFRHVSKEDDNYDYKAEPEPNPKNRREGWDVVDRENNYNEPGFEDEYVFNETVADNSRGGEIGELMEKYEREEWELRDLMKQCEDYLKTGKGAQPLKNIDEVRNLAIFYREYLAAKSDDGLPFTEQERANASEEDLKSLIEMKERLGELDFEIAAANEKAGLDRGPIDGSIVYSTNKGLDSQRNGFISNIQEKRLDLSKSISLLEDKITNPARAKVSIAKSEDSWKDVPEFSEEELKVMEASVAWLKNQRLPRPSFAKGGELNEAQILESAQEYAAYKGWPKANFRSQEFKGRRQLLNIMRFHDREANANKQVRYVQFSNDLPEGEYYFDVNPDAFFVDKKNPNFAVAPLNLMVSTENPEKFLQKKEAERSQAKRQTA